MDKPTLFYNYLVHVYNFQIGPGGWKPETLECHQDKSYDIPKHIKPFTREMKIEVSSLCLCIFYSSSPAYALIHVVHCRYK